MARTKITATLHDGRTLDAETERFMEDASDHIAFERRFKRSIAALGVLFNPDGTMSAESEFLMEWHYFFCWRVLSRQLDGQCPDFDAFCDEVSGVTVDVLDDSPKDSTETPSPTS